MRLGELKTENISNVLLKEEFDKIVLCKDNEEPKRLDLHGTRMLRELVNIFRTTLQEPPNMLNELFSGKGEIYSNMR